MAKGKGGFLKKRIFNFKFYLYLAAFSFFILVAAVPAVFSAMSGLVAASATAENTATSIGISEAVLALAPRIEEEAEKHGIEEYLPVLLAICMQESKGLGNNPFQVAGTGSINIEESIVRGVKIFTDHLAASGCENISDTNNLKIAVQAYNFGGEFITYVNSNYGGTFTAEAAENFSNKKAAQYGWAGYGDKEYIPHVFQYISFGFGSGTGSAGMVSVALAQVGNRGTTYYTWYGFPHRVEWCATFISWCANQNGYIETGIIPKFAACTSQGIPWFVERGQWQTREYIPSGGDIIFFDWGNNKPQYGADHVGMVEKVENGRVYTIEGNSTGDKVCQKSYPIGYIEIKGYGVPNYAEESE